MDKYMIYEYMIYVRRRVCSSQQQKNGPSTSMISYKTDNSEEQDGFLSISRRGYNGRNNIQYVSERIPNNALHHAHYPISAAPFLQTQTLQRTHISSIHGHTFSRLGRKILDSNWRTMVLNDCFVLPSEKKVRLSIKHADSKRTIDVAREEYANIRLFCIDFLSHFPKYVRLSGQRKETNHITPWTCGSSTPFHRRPGCHPL